MSAVPHVSHFVNRSAQPPIWRRENMMAMMNRTFVRGRMLVGEFQWRIA
jgi:hypothetical protein